MGNGTCQSQVYRNNYKKSSEQNKRNYIVVQKDVAPVIFTHFFIKVTLDSDLLNYHYSTASMTTIKNTLTVAITIISDRSAHSFHEHFS